MVNQTTRILLFSSLFPHRGEPTLGVFVENRLRHLIAEENVKAIVVAPVPWFPFKAKVFGKYGRFARAMRVEVRHGITIYHPRYLVIPKVGMNLTPMFMYWSALRCTRRLLGQGAKWNVIDAHYLYPDGVAAAKLSKKLNIPFVMTARGSDVTEIGLVPSARKMIKSALDVASHTITVSNNLRRDLVAMGGKPEQITTLRNGVDTSFFKETKRSEMRKSWGEGPIMLFAGWLIPRKRLDLVLKVTALIPGITTVIIGDGPLRSTLEVKAKHLGIYDRVIFAGQIAPEKMPEMYSGADVLLLPSDREGWANVLLESMACGTPVVTRDVGGAPDLVTQDEAGRLVKSDTPEKLSDAVKDLLLCLPDRKATRKFAQQFGWASTSKGQKQIFDAAILKYNASRTKGEITDDKPK